MNSMKIGTYQMDTTFGLYLPEYTIPAPAVQTNFVKIIGRDGSVDLSNALGLHYDSRTWSLDFKCFDPTVNWHTLSSQVMNAIHGKRLNFEFDDDPNYFWTGRVSVQNYVSNHGTGTLKATIVSDPFKYAKLSTIVTKTASTGTEYTGALVTFNTANAKINDLSVTMQPIQDLHGYDHPWPAGGGENVLDPNIKFTAGTYHGVNLATSNGYEYTLTNTATEGGTIVTNIIALENAVLLPPGTYYGSAGAYELRDENGTFLKNQYGGTAFTRNESFYVRRAYIEIINGREYNASYFIGLKKGSSGLASWSPYSNICPISGRTGLSVYRTGVNVWDEDWELGTINVSTGGNSNSSSRIRSVNYIPVLPNTEYCYVRKDDGARETTGRVCYYDINKEFISGNASFPGGVSTYSSPTTFTTPANAYYMRFSPADTYSDISINYPSSDHDYHAYSGNTYAVDWTTEAGTVYGGTDEVVGGALTDEWAEIPSYNGETITEPWLSSMDAYTPGGTPTTGAQVVYKLATPLTYQLAPQEIEALVGTNNVWSDGGNVTVAVVTPETLTNNGRAVVPTLTASADMVLKWGNYSASVQQGTSTISQLILENGANLVYIIGTGSISFTWQEASL